MNALIYFYFKKVKKFKIKEICFICYFKYVINTLLTLYHSKLNIQPPTQCYQSYNTDTL